MAWMLKGVLICLLLLMVFSTSTVCMDAEIVTSPENVTVFVDNEAQFRCVTSNVAIVDWIVNGTFFRLLNTSLHVGLDPRHERVGDYDVNTLTIKSKAEYNGTTVQCVGVLIGGGLMETENATLMIQGVLAPVGDVSVESGSDSILLSWSSPFSLNVTGVDPDIWYTVLISNVTDENNPTAVPCTDCHNLTQPNYTFTTANPSPCHKYSFTVIPQNGAGEGSRSEPVEGYFTDWPITLEGSSIKVNWIPDVEFQIFELILPKRADSRNYTVYFQSSDPECNNHTSGPLREENFILTVNASKREIKYDCKWNITIEVMNKFGMTNSTGPLEISTFDVQNATPSTFPGGVAFNGSFSDNAQGCFITLTSEASDSNDMCVALPDTSGPVNVTGLGIGNYITRIYDLENGLPGHRPAVIEEVNITEADEDSSPRDSSVLLNASIHNTTDSGLNITCNFKSDMREGATCVVVSYIRNNQHLNFTIIPMEEKYPAIIPINETGEYAVAVFGSLDSNLDREPVITKKIYLSRTEIADEHDTVTPNDPSDSISGGAVISIVAGIIIIIIIISITGITISIMVYIRSRHMYNRELQQSPMAEVTSYQKADEEEGIVGEVEVNSGLQYANVLALTATFPSKPVAVEATVSYQKIDHTATQCKAYPKNLHYSELGPRPDGLPQPPATEHSPTQYATIKHPNAPSPVSSEVECVLSENVTKEAETGPPTLDDVVSMLRPVAKKWKIIGVALKLNENFLDDVFTNMVNDEDCLVEAMDNWVKFHEPSWEKLAAALREGGEEELALKCHKEESVIQLSTPALPSTPLNPMEETHTHEADKEFTLPSAANSEFFQKPIMATQQDNDIHSCELVTTDQPTPPSSEESSSELRVHKEGLDDDLNFEIIDDYTSFKQCTAEMVCFTTDVPCLHAVYSGTEIGISTTGRIRPSTERFCNKSAMVYSATGRAYCTIEDGTEAVYPTTEIVCPANEKVVYRKAMIMSNQANVFQEEQPNSSCNTLTLHNTVRATASGLKCGTHDTREYTREELLERKPVIAEEVVYSHNVAYDFDDEAYEIGMYIPTPKHLHCRDIVEEAIYSDNKAYEIGPLSPPTNLSTVRLNSTHDYLVWGDPPPLDPTDQDPDTRHLLVKKLSPVYPQQCILFLAMKASHNPLKGGIPPIQDLSGQDPDTMISAASMFKEPLPAYPNLYTLFLTKLAKHTVHDVSLSPTQCQLFHRNKSTLRMNSQNGPSKRGCLRYFPCSGLQKTP